MPSTMYGVQQSIRPWSNRVSSVHIPPCNWIEPPVDLSQRETTSHGPLISRQSDGRHGTRGWSLSDATLLSSLDLSREGKFAIGLGLWKEDSIPPDFLQPPYYQRRERPCGRKTTRRTPLSQLMSSLSPRGHGCSLTVTPARPPMPTPRPRLASYPWRKTTHVGGGLIPAVLRSRRTPSDPDSLCGSA